MLNIKPILKFSNGIIDSLDKVRTLKASYKKAVDHMIKDGVNPEEHELFVHHSCEIERGEEIKKLILEANPNFKVNLVNIQGVILAHTGPGTVAIAVVKKFDF